MSLSRKTLSFVFLAIFVLSHHTQARDSQFFSKVTNVNNNNDNKNSNEKETTTTVVNPNNKKEEEEPAFIPETRNGGYGLYGHESGQLPPSETTTTNGEQHYTTNTNTHTRTSTYEPYNTQTTYEPYTTPVGRPYKATETEELRGTNLYANNYKSDDANNNYRYNNNNNNNFGGNKYNVERQGMSDTRFLENGKFFYDMSNEKMTYNPNTYDEKNYDPNTYRTNTNNNYNNKVIDYSNPKNWYHNRGNNNNYYGNNVNENTNSYEANKYYNNNNNNNNNSFEGYQNEEEFQENEEFVP